MGDEFDDFLRPYTTHECCYIVQFRSTVPTKLVEVLLLGDRVTNTHLLKNLGHSVLKQWNVALHLRSQSTQYLGGKVARKAPVRGAEAIDRPQSEIENSVVIGVV